MAIEVIMPKLGLTMEEGTIVSWLKREGEQLTEGESLFEVETDKVMMEVPAPASGILRKVLAEPGSTLNVGQTIAIIAGPDEIINNLPGPPAAIAQTIIEPKQLNTGGVAEAQTTSDLLFKASPAAKKLAREYGIDLRGLKGSGPGGRIIESDVSQAISNLSSVPSMPQTRTSVTQIDKPDPTASAIEDTITLSGIRKRSAERMAESFQTIPHFYLTMEVLADRLVSLREALLGPVQEKAAVRVSYTDLLVKGLAWALRRHPDVNSAWEEGKLRRNRDINVGIAVATKEGLVVPVIHHADTLSLVEIASRRKAVVEAARSKKLGLDLLEGGTVTLTNLGSYGVDSFAPIINPPQAAILAAGRITERAVAIRGMLALRPTVFLTLAADHRVLDGHLAGSFLSDVRMWLESAEVSRLESSENVHDDIGPRD